jgi:hypothetical protein
MTAEDLPIKQRQIIARAASYLKPGQRETYSKFVMDVLRAKPQPCSNTDIRSACCASLLKYRTRPCTH